MSEAPQQPVAPLSIDTVLQPVDELDPAQRPNLAGFLGMVRVLAALAALSFSVALVAALLAPNAHGGRELKVCAALSFIVAVATLLALLAHQGFTASRSALPFHTPLRRLLWLLAAPPIVALFVLVLFVFHVVVVAGGVDGDLLHASRTAAVMAHADLVQALGLAALAWGPGYPIAAAALMTQSGLRSWVRAPLWILTLIGWAVVIGVDPLGVSGLVR